MLSIILQVCDLCGIIATSRTECKGCNSDKISKANFPYSGKLLLYSINAMGIKTSITVNKDRNIK